jgi:LEA14-like dessication related protein
MRYVHGVRAWLVLIWLAGCAVFPGSLERPKVTLAALTLIDANLFEQRFGLKLRVQNPNRIDLPVQALTYDVELNDKAFGSGVARAPVTVPGYGSELIDVEMISNLSGLLRQLAEYSKSGVSTLRYRLKGNVILGPWNTRLPFEQSGEIAIPAF